jgi:hypothetical protein
MVPNFAAAFALRVAAAFSPATRRFRVSAAFFAAARRLRVRAAFCPGVSSESFAIRQFYMNRALCARADLVCYPFEYGTRPEVMKLDDQLRNDYLFEFFPVLFKRFAGIPVFETLHYKERNDRLEIHFNRISSLRRSYNFN